MNHYIHDVPGRLRIKSPIIKKNRDAEYELKKILGRMSGIATVDINLTTGSLLVNYNPKAVKRDDILNLLQRNGYFDASKAVTNDQYIHSAASKAGMAIGKALFGAFIGTFLEDSPLSFLTILI